MQNFIFDLYNTLIDIRTDEHREQTWLPVAAFCRERGINTDPSTLSRVHDEAWACKLSELEGQKKFKYPEADMVEVFREMGRRLGGEWSAETAEEAAKCMRRASRVWLKPFDGTLELFVRLKALGAKIYLLSNAQACITYDEIEECGLLERFDGIMISSEHGCRKPDPAFFKLLFDKYGLDKKDSVMIGDDKESDGKGAKAAGIKFLLAEGGAAKYSDKIIKLAQAK